MQPISPRVSATKLRGPDTGLSWAEATHPTNSIAADTELHPPTGGLADSQASENKEAVQSYLQRGEMSEQAAPAVQASTSRQLDFITKSPVVQQASRETLQKESQSLGKAEGSRYRILDQQAEEVLRLLGGVWEVGKAEQPDAAAMQPTSRQQPSANDEPLSAYMSPHLRQVAQVEQEFNREEAPLFDQAQHEVAAAEEHARTAELKTGEAVQEAREWAAVMSKVEEERLEARKYMQQAQEELDRSERAAKHGEELKQALAQQAQPAQQGSPRSPLPRGRKGLLQRAQQLARQAANLEEEAKRKEARAFYLATEAQHLAALSQQKREQVRELEAEEEEVKSKADELEAAVARELAEAKRDQQAAEEKWREAAEQEGRLQLKEEARILSERTDVRAARAELHLVEAEEAVQHAETVKSALIQARRDADLMHSRAEHLEREAETMLEGAKALMQRASEKAAESLEAKRAAQQAPELESGFDATMPCTPETAAEKQRMAEEMKQAQNEVASAQVHASQLAQQARRKVEHVGQLQQSAEMHASHMRRVLADAASAQTEEEESLRHAQCSGEVATRRASARMVEQWQSLEASPEWQQLARRFPETIRHLSQAVGSGVLSKADSAA